MAEPVWVDYIPKVTPPLPIEVERRALAIAVCRSAAQMIVLASLPMVDAYMRRWQRRDLSRHADDLTRALMRLGEIEMRRLGLAPPPAKPNPRNPSGLIIGGSGGALGLATFPTYPEPKL